MKVTFLYRHPGDYSVEHVFNIVGNELIKKGVEINNIFMPRFRARIPDLLINLLYTWRHKGKNLVHITGDVYYCMLCLCPKRTIMTIHDFGRVSNHFERPGIKLLAFFWYYLPLKIAQHITCISQFTRDEMCKYYPWARKKLIIIHNPVDPQYKQTPKDFTQNCPIILQIGTGENKNFERTIEALSTIKCHFRIVGKPNKKQFDLMKTYQVDYSWVSHISDEKMIDEYKKCDIVSFPSWYEGFGMPVIEGQAIGRIVLTSNIEPLKEIGNEGAVFVNPYQVESIRNGFKKIIEDANYRNDVIQKGFQNVKLYQADYIAEQYLKLYNEILNNE